MKRDQKRFLRSFLFWIVCMSIGGFTWYRIIHSEQVEGTPWLLKNFFEWNQKVANLFYKPTAIAPVFDEKLAGVPRENGDIGMGEDFEPNTWKLKVEFPNKSFAVSLEEIKKLPHVEMVTELKCIEGWSQIVKWGGVRLGDFLRNFGLVTYSNPPTKNELFDTPFTLGLETPDHEYYVGLDMATVMHDQTLLAYEMDGKPLTLEHGAPLRLATPLKYGIKNIKRIGTLKLTNGRARDYWAENGYDWNSSH